MRGSNLYSKEEEHDNRFVIGGGAPHGEISWQVTATRHGPYIHAHPIINEVWKGPGQPVRIGECLFEPLCNSDRGTPLRSRFPPVSTAAW
jgi:hypothetical protein